MCDGSLRKVPQPLQREQLLAVPALAVLLLPVALLAVPALAVLVQHKHSKQLCWTNAPSRAGK